MKDNACRLESMNGLSIGLLRDDMGYLFAEIHVKGRVQRFEVAEWEAAALSEWIRKHVEPEAFQKLADRMT